MFVRLLPLAFLACLLPFTSARADFTQKSNGASRPLSWDRRQADTFFIFTDTLLYGSEVQTGDRANVPRVAGTTSRDTYKAPAPRIYKNRPEDKALEFIAGTAGGQGTEVYPAPAGLPRTTSTTTFDK